MDIRKTLGELDSLFEEKRFGEIESFLLGRLKEADCEDDSSSVLALSNELLGFYRSSSRFREALLLCEDILHRMKIMGLEGSIPYATSLLNVATAYREAGKIKDSISFYDDALKIYESTLPEDDLNLASLYNNMSQAFIEMKDYKKACNLLEKALSILSRNEGTDINAAITHSNLAMTLMKMGELGEASGHIKKSLDIFEKAEGPKNPAYSPALIAMGEFQFMSGDYESSLVYFKKALGEIERNMGRNKQHAVICSNISLVYDKLNNPEQKEKYAAMADEILGRLK